MSLRECINDHHALITTHSLGIKKKLGHQNLLGGFVVENVFLRRSIRIAD